ncbi:MAG: pseudouridine synthase [Patescibacteria group bacterium]|nr:rRNA pseudouridine synthase [Patescibacteria group bacterium]
MRLNKFIADSGYCSRRKADALIEEGRVLINNRGAKLGDQVNNTDSVIIDDTPIINEGKEDIYIAFHKPAGVICSFDPKLHNTLADWVDVGERIFHVGRLDVASSGLLLLTNNGAIAEAITHPRGEHEKEYVVTLDKKFTRSFIDQMRDGVVILGSKTKPARVKKLSDKKFSIVLTEGRNRQIRRMCEKLGYEVKKLRRTRVINVELGSLGEGNWRELTKKERRGLLEAVK